MYRFFICGLLITANKLKAYFSKYIEISFTCTHHLKPSLPLFVNLCDRVFC